MKNLNPAIILEKNKLSSTGAWLVLAKITLTDNTIFRLVKNTSDVVYGEDKVNIPTATLEANWKMDESTADGIVHDSSANFNDSVGVNSLTFVSGFKNNCAVFSTASQIDCGNDISLQSIFESMGTISFWLWAGVNSNKVIWSKGDFKIVLSASGTAILFYAPFTATSGLWVAPLSTAAWTHIAITYDSSSDANVPILYVNGSVVAFEPSTIPSGTVVSQAATNMRFGKTGPVTYNSFSGKIDEVRIYSSVLSSEEVGVIYNVELGMYDATYTAFPFEIEPYQQNDKGEVSSLVVKVSNISRFLQPKLQELKGAIGSVVRLMIVNSNLLSENYTELDMSFDVVSCSSDERWVSFTLGSPNLLNQRYPLERYISLHCRWKFKSVGCGYAGTTIDDITLTGTDRVVISTGSTPHDLIEATSIRIDSVEGTVELNGQEYIIELIDDYSFYLNATDSSNFTAYTGGGVVGYSFCKRILTDCRERNNSPRFGGFPGLRNGGVRLV